MIITVYIAILNLNTTILVYTGKTPIFFPLKILKRFIWNRHAHCNKTNDFLKFSLLLIASQTGLVLHMHIHHCFYLQSSTILNPQNVVWSYCLSHAQGHPVPLPLLPTQVHTTDSCFFFHMRLTCIYQLKVWIFYWHAFPVLIFKKIPDHLNIYPCTPVYNHTEHPKTFPELPKLPRIV